MTVAAIRIKESVLDPGAAVLDRIVPSGEPCLLAIEKGQTLRIVDVQGNQAVDVIFYNRHDPAERSTLWLLERAALTETSSRKADPTV